MKLQVIHFSANTDLPISVRNALPDDQSQDIVRSTLNQHLGNGSSEMNAYIKAYRALEAAGYTRNGSNKWQVKKEAPAVGDVHVNRPLGSDDKKQKKPERKDDPGTQDVAPPHQGDPVDLLISKRISGNSDISLNDKGRKLAQRLGERIHLKGGLDVLHNSPLTRAKETAEAILEANPSTYHAKPSPALQPWHLGDYEGKMPHDVKDLIRHYIEHPDQVPPGKGADGQPAEAFNNAVKRQLDELNSIHDECMEHPTLKIGVVMHSRGMELTQSYVDAGCPEDYTDLDLKDLEHPDDPDHATMLRWGKDKIKEIELDDDDELKGGMYLILHSLTDDDTDEGNEQLEKRAVDRKEAVQIKMYLPPIEVHRAAKSAYEAGTAVLDITAPLAEGTGLGEAEIKKVAEHFETTESATEPETTRNAWGGAFASKWAARVLKKITNDAVTKADDERAGAEKVYKAGSGVMLAFWPDESTATKLAAEDGEKPEDLHITLAYFGKLDEVGPEKIAALEVAVKSFADSHSPVSATLGGIGRFPATPNSDNKDVAYLGVHSDQIQAFRNELVNLIEAHGVEPKKTFGYNPHMTLKTVAPHAPHLLSTPESTPVTFSEIVLSIGDEKKVYPLGGAEKAEFEIHGNVVKLDQTRHLVFGWFSIVNINGRPIEDTQGDLITEATLEDAAYGFVLNARKGGAMHETNSEGTEVRGIGRLVESVVFTTEKVAAMLSSLHDQGIEAVIDLKCIPWWGGMYIEDDAVWQRVTTGELQAWSIGGKGKRDKIG